MGSSGKKVRSSFLKERTKELLIIEVGVGAQRTPSRKSFCFFFQKEVLSSLEGT
jgi:hypothetical protein